MARISDSLVLYDGLSISDSLELSSGLDIRLSDSVSLPPVMQPRNVAVSVVSFDPLQNRYSLNLDFDHPDDGVADEYQYDFTDHSDQLPAWISLGQTTSRGFGLIRDASNSDPVSVMVRAIKNSRYSQVVSVPFSAFTYPAIGVPQNIEVGIISESSNNVELRIDWESPANAFGRTVTYHAGANNFGYVNMGNVNTYTLNYTVPLSTITHINIFANASGANSSIVRINKDDFLTGYPPRNFRIRHVIRLADWGYRIRWNEPRAGAVDHYELRVMTNVLFTIDNIPTSPRETTRSYSREPTYFEIRAVYQEQPSLIASDWVRLNIEDVSNRGGSSGEETYGIILSDSTRTVLTDFFGNALDIR